MKALDQQIVTRLQNGEDAASIAEALHCSISRVHVVAGRYGAMAASADRAREAKRRQDTKSYHVTAVLSAAESRKYMELLPKAVCVPGKSGERVTLVMGYQSALMRREEADEDA